MEKLLIYYKGDHLLIQGDIQDREDAISTEIESVHNQDILDMLTIGHDNICVQDTRSTEQEVMIDTYSVSDHTSLQCDTRDWENSISLNEPEPVPRTNDSLKIVQNDNMFQDTQRTVQKDISDEYP